MKSYTDIEQSKKLAKILPIESADCFWDYDDLQKYHRIAWFEDGYNKDSQLRLNINNTPAWTLSALLNVLSSATLDSSDDHYYRVHCMGRYTEWYDNPIDACYEIILKLNEQKLL